MPNQDVSAVQRSQEYFRLKRVVQSPGDIFELNESTREVYIGPDSDIAEVRMQYFNPDEPLGLETATVSVNGPFVGRVDVLTKTQVPSTGQPARILLSPVDIVDNAYAPPLSLAFRRFNVPAIIDVICATQRLSSIPSVRADRTLRFPQVPYEGVAVNPPADDGSTDLIVPIYGRRMVTVTAISAIGLDMAISLVTLLESAASIPRPISFVTVPASLPVTLQTKTQVFRASDAARIGQIFDLSGAPPPLEKFAYLESDQGGDDVSTGFVAARGMADLMLINLKRVTGSPVIAGTRFADIFIKISDRET